MDWEKRLLRSLELQPEPDAEWEAPAPDGVLVALAYVGRFGSHGPPGVPLEPGQQLLVVRFEPDRETIGSPRWPTLEEIRSAVDDLCQPGTVWTLPPMKAHGEGTTYPAPRFNELPLLLVGRAAEAPASELVLVRP